MKEFFQSTQISARNTETTDVDPPGIVLKVNGSADEAGISTHLSTGKRSKLLLFLGPTGAGKSTLIRKLASIDGRFQYIVPFTTRELRKGETDKVRVSTAQLDVMEHEGQLLARNRIYEHEYGTPRYPIEQSLRAGRFPCLDWPVKKLDSISDAFPGRVYKIYIAPPSLDTLQQRLQSDGRDPTGTRFVHAREELHAFWNGSYTGLIDLIVTNEDCKILRIAQAIREKVLSATMQVLVKPLPSNK